MWDDDGRYLRDLSHFFIFIYLIVVFLFWRLYAGHPAYGGYFEGWLFVVVCCFVVLIYLLNQLL